MMDMNCLKIALSALCLASAVVATAAESKDQRCYEMRIYYAAPGKTDAMHARFRDHTVKLFARHGMENLGYWTPLEEKDGPTNMLVYVLAYPDREAREKSWKAFSADPDWQAAYKNSEKDGRLVEKAEQRFLTATDYSPSIKPSVAGPRVFEMRTYTASKGNLERLNARFRDHTVELFQKHGIANVAYWTPSTGEPGAEDTLLYFISHASREAAGESFKRFGADPAWQAARKNSEEAAGGSLTAPGGVKSVFMKATDYSPTR